MNIGVNARHLIKNQLEGIGWYSYEILIRITKNHPEHDFYFFFDRKFSEEFVFNSNVFPIVVSPKARHPILFKWWFDYALPKKFKELKIDLFFSPDGFLSLKTQVPQIGVIHDLNFEHYPKDLPINILKYYKKNMPLFAQKAQKIITVSEFSKKDICNLYGIKENKVKVVYNGGNKHFKPLDKVERQKFVAINNNGRPYFIYVGSLHKRKNIRRMLEAFQNFNNKNEYDFVIVGEPMWQKQLNLDGVLENVKFQGRKSGEELSKWVASSKALVYVSYFEGFGLPVLEGMMAGTPVITSGVTSMPEVGGESVIYVNPFDINSIKTGMELAISKYDTYRKLGLKQSINFNWDKSAKKLFTYI